jgi:hypothetical protein
MHKFYDIVCLMKNTNPLVAGFINRVRRDLIDPDYNRRRVREILEQVDVPNSSEENDSSILHGAIEIKDDYEESLLPWSFKKPIR